jgi:hypothetical protein
MRAPLFIYCRHAEVADGLLFISAGGLDWRSSGPMRMTVACMFEIGSEELNTDLPFSCSLIDADGQPVTICDGGEPVELVMQGNLHLRRPAIREAVCSVVNHPAVFTFESVPLAEGRYQFVLDADSERLAACSFAVRS